MPGMDFFVDKSKSNSLNRYVQSLYTFLNVLLYSESSSLSLRTVYLLIYANFLFLSVNKKVAL